MQFLTGLVNDLNSFSSGQVAASIAVVLEIVLRVIPSSKPMGVLITIGSWLTEIGSLFGATSKALDTVVPQVLTTPAAPSTPAA